MSTLKWYIKPFKDKKSRKGASIFPHQIYASYDMLNEISKTIPKYYNDKPLLLLWAKKDLAFNDSEYNIFKSWFKDNQFISLHESAHFWQEDQGNYAAKQIREWILNKFRK